MTLRRFCLLSDKMKFLFMNDLKFFDDRHKLLTIEQGMPTKLRKYAIAEANAYHIKVGKSGYMLFQHIPGGVWNIWISHYIFNKRTTVYCEGSILGVEFHNIIEGYALYKNNNDEWQHFNAGDHNILHNPKIKSVAKFDTTPLVTFDVHMTTVSFKELIADQPKFRNWVHYFSAGVNAKLFKHAASKNLPVQGIITEIIEKCNLSLFDGNGNKDLLNKFLTSVLKNEGAKCDYNFSFEDVKRLIKAKEYLTRSVNERISLANLHVDAMMGHKKFTEGFKLLFGTVPSTFVLKERIKVCKSLMMDQRHLTNDDYALIMNFNSGGHFARTFKMLEGCSPKEYRKKHNLIKKDTDDKN